MLNEIIFETLIDYFRTEIANQISYTNNYLEVVVNDEQRIKIFIRESK